MEETHEGLGKLPVGYTGVLVKGQSIMASDKRFRHTWTKLLQAYEGSLGPWMVSALFLEPHVHSPLNIIPIPSALALPETFPMRSE